jgi:hypothetical protein
VFSHPLVVEAIASKAAAVALVGAEGGEVSAAPALRFIGSDGKDLAPPLEGAMRPHVVVNSLSSAIEKQTGAALGYLVVVAEELRSVERELPKAVFAMGCFWEGQAKLGGLTGVIDARVGMLDGHEVVELYFDPELITSRCWRRRGARAARRRSTRRTRRSGPRHRARSASALGSRST